MRTQNPDFLSQNESQTHDVKLQIYTVENPLDYYQVQSTHKI